MAAATRHDLHGEAGRGSETAVRWLGQCRRFSNKTATRFFFSSNDHARIHVHVRRGEGESLLVVEPDLDLRESVGFNERELSRAEDLIDDHLELITQIWAEHRG